MQAPAVLAALVTALGCDQPVQEQHRQPVQVETAADVEEHDREPEPAAAETTEAAEGTASESSPEFGDADAPAASGEHPDRGAAITTAAEDRPQRMDPDDLFIDSAPLPPPPPTPHLADTLDNMRAAMRARDFLATRQHLQEAISYRRTGEDKRAFERILLVHALWAQGWHHATTAAAALTPGERLSTWAGPAIVEEKSDEEIMLRLSGVPQRFSIRLPEMEVRLAAALLKHRARQTGLALDAHVAALWIFDSEDSTEAARQACIDAAQRGLYVDFLIAELSHRERMESE